MCRKWKAKETFSLCTELNLAAKIYYWTHLAANKQADQHTHRTEDSGGRRECADVLGAWESGRWTDRQTSALFTASSSLWTLVRVRVSNRTLTDRWCQTGHLVRESQWHSQSQSPLWSRGRITTSASGDKEEKEFIIFSKWPANVNMKRMFTQICGHKHVMHRQMQIGKHLWDSYCHVRQR